MLSSAPSSKHPEYRGRFAPSPTGPLHFGSLVTAVASYLDARAHQGSWIIRMEDLDRPREIKGAAESIVETLASLGMISDQPIMRQSDRDVRYQQVLDDLIARQSAYPCVCTRKELVDSQVAAQPMDTNAELRYPGTCRKGIPVGRAARCWRLKVSAEPISFVDRIQGRSVATPSESVGDFVLRRADQLFAYQLAVVVDDHDQEITHVVRGADLLSSTVRQMELARQLQWPSPQFAHVPLALNEQRQKLSKQTLAAAVDTQRPEQTLRQVLRFLRQPDADLSLPELWHFAIHNWSIVSIPSEFGYLL
jgi:glutamyl-Q tRNA(Asp) synthetase